DAVDDDDEHDRGNHRRGGGQSDRRGAPPRLHAPEAADQRDHDAEHRRLAEADEEAGQTQGASGLLEILGEAESEHPHPDDRPAKNPDEGRVGRRKRQRRGTAPPRARPAMTMAVMMQPISRVIATATRLATKIEAPNWRSWTAPTNPRMSPIKKLMRLTMPSARGPQSSMTTRKSIIRNRARARSRDPRASSPSPRNARSAAASPQSAVARAPIRTRHARRARSRRVRLSGTASARRRRR